MYDVVVGGDSACTVIMVDPVYTGMTVDPAGTATFMAAPRPKHFRRARRDGGERWTMKVAAVTAPVERWRCQNNFGKSQHNL